LGLAACAFALDALPLEALDLVGGHLAEGRVEHIARLELLAVYEDGARAGVGVAVVVEVAEELEAAVLEPGGAVLELAGEARDVVVHELRRRGVVADDDEARRGLHLGLAP